MSKHFDQETLNLLSRAKLIRMETSRPGGPVHRTIIWVIVDGTEVYVRSYRGRAGRWYREVRANPQAAVLVKKLRIPVRAVQARSARAVARVSRGYFKKYGRTPPAIAMVRREILSTTLRLEPA